MTLFNIISILISLTAAFAYINYRFIHLPSAIGLTVVALVMSLAVAVFGRFQPEMVVWAQQLIDREEEHMVHNLEQCKDRPSASGLNRVALPCRLHI